MTPSPGFFPNAGPTWYPTQAWEGRGRLVNDGWMHFCRCFWISKQACFLFCDPVVQSLLAGDSGFRHPCAEKTLGTRPPFFVFRGSPLLGDGAAHREGTGAQEGEVRKGFLEEV